MVRNCMSNMSNCSSGKWPKSTGLILKKADSKIFAAAIEAASVADDIRGQGHVTSSLKKHFLSAVNHIETEFTDEMDTSQASHRQLFNTATDGKRVLPAAMRKRCWTGVTTNNVE